MTELIPFSLVTPAAIGFSLGFCVSSVVAVITLMTAWAVSVVPDVTLKLVSDLLGFALWLTVSSLIARELRTAALATKLAQAKAAESQRLTAEQRSKAEIAELREAAHREIHDYLLPVVEHVAAEEPISNAWVRLADQGRVRARRLLDDKRTDSESSPQFAVALEELVDTFTGLGLTIEWTIVVSSELPAETTDALVGAVREAFSNIVKHSRSREPVQLFAEDTTAGVTVTVRDHGVGFSPATITPGGGFSRTFEAVRARGGACTIESPQGGGTKVILRWPK